jgi:diguanylate cyclase
MNAETLRFATAATNSAHGAHVDAISAATTSMPGATHVPGRDDGTASPDFDLLLAAVGSRLRSTVGNDAQTPVPSEVRNDVLECVEALEQLHASLTCERQRNQRHQQSAEGARRRLAQAMSDLAASKVGEARAQHFALHDDLTSLPNRRFFRERLDQALLGMPQAAPALAVLYLDVDGMKAVNDEHGHGIGDQLLIVVASRLLHTLRSADVVSRLGGDEFALLLADMPCPADVAQWADRLCAAVSAPFQLGPLQLQAHVSIGIAMCPQHGKNAIALVHNADRAMYQAKRQRCGHAFFDAAVTA